MPYIPEMMIHFGIFFLLLQFLCLNYLYNQKKKYLCCHFR